MKKTFRLSMAWLHTWSGLVMGWLLFTIFITGTIAFFRSEITYWMQPELHDSVPGPQTLDHALDRLKTVSPGAAEWRVSLPDDRDPTVQIRWREYGETGGGKRGGHRETLNAANGQVIEPRETAGGGFLYRFHFELYALDRNTARTIVGIATMCMLVAIISGIITHKKIFTEFFTFRPKKGQRSWLDAHAVTAVLALPFHLMITFSGLLLVSSSLLSWNYEPRHRPPPHPVQEQVLPQTQAIPDIAALIASAEKTLGETIKTVNIQKPGTGKMTIALSSDTTDSLSQGGGGGGRQGKALTFNAEGEPIIARQSDRSVSAVSAISNTLGTLHRARFSKPSLRWLFFLAGVLGTLMIATGLVLWCVKRGRKQLSELGFRFVSAMNLASIGSLTTAIAVFFWSNRLIPASAAGRADLEVASFFIAWGVLAAFACYKHDKTGWKWQLGAAAVLFLLLPLFGAMTSGAAWRLNWTLAGFNTVSFATGIGCAVAVWFLHAQTAPKKSPSRSGRQKTGKSILARSSC